MTTAAAIVACLVLAFLTAFQVLLIAGAPLGKFAWGGAHRVLPTRLRAGSALSIVLYGFFALLVLDKADLVNVFGNERFVDVAMWVSAGYFLVGTGLNAISRSKRERTVMTPVALMLASCFLLVAAS